jgi:hypothetical protein
MTRSLAMRRWDGVRETWWDNFVRTTRIEKYGEGLKFPQCEWVDHRSAVLETYNAVYDGKYVHFKTEQDAMWFILRWS